MWLNLAESEVKNPNPNPNPNSNSKPAVPEFDPEVISMFRNSLQELPSDDPFQIKDDGKVGVSEKGGGWVGAVAGGIGGVRKGVGSKGKWGYKFKIFFLNINNDIKIYPFIINLLILLFLFYCIMPCPCRIRILNF